MQWMCCVTIKDSAFRQDEKTAHNSKIMNTPPATPILTATYQLPSGLPFPLTPHTLQSWDGASPPPSLCPPTIQQWNHNDASGQNTPSPQPASVLPTDLASMLGVVPAIVVDNLAKDFKLDVQQHSNLHTFVQVGIV
jgi:hypothetical protein